MSREQGISAAQRKRRRRESSREVILHDTESVGGSLLEHVLDLVFHQAQSFHNRVHARSENLTLALGNLVVQDCASSESADIRANSAEDEDSLAFMRMDEPVPHSAALL